MSEIIIIHRMRNWWLTRPSEPPIPHTMNYDYLRHKGDDFFSQGVVTYKGDFVQTSSGKVITQRKEGVLYWEDIPFALPPVGDLRWKAFHLRSPTGGNAKGISSQ